MSDPLRELFDVIEDRKETMPEDSYTASLLADDEKGENAALEKVGEEATEFLLAAKDGDTDELAHEGADVVYHMLVVLAQQDMDVEALLAELDDRR
ncbi:MULTISPECIES: phosphoribosyl-ATP diphosphatase [Halobacterium]|uniref:Phosphoribosyl-ATP pyrophosphatase n=1 Tax=Halobacterium salinarum (strain ATCC 33171 / DSM 3754 / JCM 8978 / NBRC 102687 / NCIMB 764 / 91-R6) TaxID=2597657 RepID=A0A4D6GQD1_HALS9|nr:MULTISPECIES: phosphoribosyl-ATP diphosphatase [Halobacterium]MCF2206211.1 phosphoribosyl-ATP diphosphatase [Halobacterium salinarum]MCF2240743.1 phosphoribosyl-ATP diphosphatase [Halobacterium salinarum]MDL0119247.1 phosphoribosyl-ATP diphosphatase [Halobacterium salinarum]MDL0122892.1 phosphoribosyl-ATP diphosphatase [Halobacterium salinarum]MDL0124795.1 phosphoribosyl-ATP diphosphatase [Halobacterium salinarum]